MSTVHSLLLGYPSLLDTVCPLLLDRYLSVCYCVCDHQLLLTVCPCVIGWFMSTVNPLLLGYPSLLDTVCSLLFSRYLSVCYCVCPSIIAYCLSVCYRVVQIFGDVSLYVCSLYF